MYCLFQGAWKPSLNISTVLTSIQLLMNEPNPDDALMADIVSFHSFVSSLVAARFDMFLFFRLSAGSRVQAKQVSL